MSWLYDELEEALGSLQASQEREHILGFLRRAKVIKLSNELTQAISSTMLLSANSIENNLEHVMLPSQCVWLEYDHKSRILDRESVQTHSPERVGCLLACEPENPEHIVIFAAWQFEDKRLFHSYALMHWNTEDFFELSSSAKGKKPGVDDRLLQASKTTVPPGFRSELEIWQLGQTSDSPNHNLKAVSRVSSQHTDTTDKPSDLDNALGQTRKDIVGEHIFLLTAVLMLVSNAVKFVPVELEVVEEAHIELSEEDSWAEGIVALGEEERLEAQLEAPEPKLFQKRGFSTAWFSNRLLWLKP